MLKYLVIALILALLFYSPLFKSLRGRLRDGGKATPPEGAHGKSREAEHPDPAVPMLPCAHCGVHVPATDALKDGHDRVYCSAAHRQAGPAQS